MTEADPVVAIVLAAGLSTRFAGDKLLYPLDGRPLAEHVASTLELMPLAHLLAVCPAGSGLRASIFAGHGFEIVYNAHPQEGMGSSLALGAARAVARGATRVLVCLADMPHVTIEHLARLLDASAATGVAATVSEGVRSPPAAFSGPVLDELTKLSGDAGARHLLSRATLVPAGSRLVLDYDTPSDFDAGV